MATKEVPLGRPASWSQVWIAAVTAVRGVGFWGAIVLPLSYAPLLYGGLGGQQRLLLVGLVFANLACLVVGREHAREK